MLSYCQRCVMPSTRPGEWKTKAEPFDKNGVCVACRNFDKRKDIDWTSRWMQLKKLCDKYRSSETYDCLIPVSGGKDSTYLVHTMKKRLGMNPILVNVSDPFTHTKAGEDNLHNISKTFNCDVIQYRISEDLFRRAVCFNFEETGEPLVLVEAAIYTIPMNMAVKYGIPLLIQGEDPNYEYGSVENDSPSLIRHYNKILSAVNLKYWTDRGFQEEELNCIIPDRPDLNGILMPIPFSYYEPWDGYHHMEIAKQWGFKDLTHEWIRESAFENFDQIDSVGWIMDLWLKWPKFGYSRATDLACRWIREGRISREEAIKLVNERDSILDQRVLDDFLNFTGYSVREFYDIVEPFWNKDIFEKVNGIWKKKKEYLLT